MLKFYDKQEHIMNQEAFIGAVRKLEGAGFRREIAYAPAIGFCTIGNNLDNGLTVYTANADPGDKESFARTVVGLGDIVIDKQSERFAAGGFEITTSGNTTSINGVKAEKIKP